MKKGILYIVVTALAFSTMEIAGKPISGMLNPFQITFLRFLIGGLLMLPFAMVEMRKRGIKLRRSDLAFFAGMGVICIVVSMSLLQLAVMYTKASIASTVFSTNPVFTIPFALLILKERPGKRTALSMGISLLGILFIFNPFSAAPDIKGILLAAVAAISFSLYSVLSKMRIAQYGSLVLNCFSFLFGVALLGIGLVCFEVPVFQGVSVENIGYLLYLGIFVSCIGYLSYFEAMKQTTAVMSSVVFFIKPGLAPLLAFIILRESISWNMAVGIVCILIGALVLFMQRRRQAAA